MPHNLIRNRSAFEAFCCQIFVRRESLERLLSLDTLRALESATTYILQSGGYSLPISTDPTLLSFNRMASLLDSSFVWFEMEEKLRLHGFRISGLFNEVFERLMGDTLGAFAATPTTVTTDTFTIPTSFSEPTPRPTPREKTPIFMPEEYL